MLYIIRLGFRSVPFYVSDAIEVFQTGHVLLNLKAVAFDGSQEKLPLPGDKTRDSTRTESFEAI